MTTTTAPALTATTVEMPLGQIKDVSKYAYRGVQFHKYGGMWRLTQDGVVERRYLGQWLRAVRQATCSEAGANCEAMRHTCLCLAMTDAGGWQPRR